MYDEEIEEVEQQFHSDLLTNHELAKKLGVHDETVRIWRRTGRIPFLRLSERKYKYELHKVVRALQYGN